MTVNDFEMNVRARGMRAGHDDANEEQWKELAGLSDGRREKWMTDRAKNALGTPKLASVFLQEEKRRIYRLRKIKSVLASGKLMGDGGGTTSHSTTLPDRRGRRRPYPNPSQHYGQVQQTYHRRFQRADDTNSQFIKPNYPTNPFGNDCKDAVQFPVPLGRRSSLEEAVRSGRNEASLHAKHTSSIGRSETTWDDDTRAIQEVVSVLGGGQQGLYESRSDLHRIRETPAERADKRGSLYSGYKGHNSSSSELGSEKGHSMLQGSPPHTSSSAKAEGNQAISSGPSAIDLFDQCGFVPLGAVEKEGLVGTTNKVQPHEESADYDNKKGIKDCTPSAIDSTPNMYPIAPIAPLGPGGMSSTNEFRGAINHPRDARRHEARALRTKRTQAASLKHGVQPRRPFVGGTTSTSSRSKLAHQQGSSPPGKVVNTSKGVPSDATTTETTSRRSRAVGMYSVGSPCSAEPSAPGAQTDTIRVRRRWNVDEASPTAAAASSVPLSPARAAGAGAAAAAAGGVEAMYSESPSASASASLSASEQRIVSAKVRLHKDKDLDALKSEHVEALSILQDISCPSTATATLTSAESGLDTTEEKQEEGGGKIVAGVKAVEATRNRSGKLAAVANSCDPGIVGLQTEGGAEAQGLPLEAKLDALAADLPRIGSQEQAALREMYRKWWMKVASGGSPPSPCIPAGLLEVSEATLRGGQTNDMPGKHETNSKDALPVNQQGLLIQGGVTGNSGNGPAEDLCTAPRTATDLVEDDRSNALGGPALSAVGAHPSHGVGVGMELGVVAAEPALEGGGDHSKTCMAGENGDHAQDTIVADSRETAAAGDVVLRATDVSTAIDKAPATEEADNPPAGEGSNSTSGVPAHIGVDMPPREDGGWEEEAAGAAGIASTTEKAENPPAEEANTTSGVPLHVGIEVPPREEGGRGGEAMTAVTSVLVSQQQQQQQQRQQQQQQQQPQAIASDVESVSEDDGLEKEQEEGHHGRIYLPDGRFVSTWRNSAEREKIADADRKIDLDRVDGDSGGRGAVDEVVDNSVAKESDDESLGYEDEEFDDE